MFIRQFKIDLQTTKLYHLHIVAGKYSFTRKRLTTKFRELNCDLFSGNASNPCSKIGIRLDEAVYMIKV